MPKTYLSILVVSLACYSSSHIKYGPQFKVYLARLQYGPTDISGQRHTTPVCIIVPSIQVTFPTALHPV